MEAKWHFVERDDRSSDGQKGKGASWLRRKIEGLKSSLLVLSQASGGGAK